MSTWDVTVVGEVYVDHVLSGFTAWPQPGEELFAERYTRELGGGAANTACGLSMLGRSVRLLAVIGSEDAGWFEQRLTHFGVATDGLHHAKGWTGTTIAVSTREDRSFFTHTGANSHLSEMLSRRDVIAQLAGAKHVHFAMPLSRTLAGKLLPLLREAGCTISLDVGYQPAWLGDAENLTTCQSVHYLLPNAKEAALLCDSDDAADYFAFARTARLRAPVLKLGARGAMGTDGGVIRIVAPPSVTSVDTTGAGDAFDAGFIDAVLDGASMDDCLRRGCICGALSTRAAGALAGLPDRAELKAVHEQAYGS